MGISIEQRVRRELIRELRTIERMRDDPTLMCAEARAQHADTLTRLEAAWERARDAIEALTYSVGPDATRFSAEFGTAWSLLKAELRRASPHGSDAPYPVS